MKAAEHDQLLRTPKSRFEKHIQRHAGVTWAQVLVRIEAKPAALKALMAMESSGGEPDVIDVDTATGEVLICDCAAESPSGRRSLCFDDDALHACRENKPAGSAVEMARAMGIELLSEAQYRVLQQLGEFDLKTSSWIATPDDVRTLGGALFFGRRYGRVFVHHNGAQSCDAARGLRGLLRV
jgi:Protein of unknown function (DUF4256)